MSLLKNILSFSLLPDTLPPKVTLPSWQNVLTASWVFKTSTKSVNSAPFYTWLFSLFLSISIITYQFDHLRQFHRFQLQMGQTNLKEKKMISCYTYLYHLVFSIHIYTYLLQVVYNKKKETIANVNTLEKCNKT